MDNLIYVNIPALLSEPEAAKQLDAQQMHALARARKWEDMDFGTGIRLRLLCDDAAAAWVPSLGSLGEALAADQPGAKVFFRGAVRTKNWSNYDNRQGLSGDLESDPHLYTDVAGCRVYFPLEPAWAVTTTSGVLLSSGNVRLSLAGTLRSVEGHKANVSPTLIGTY